MALENVDTLPACVQPGLSHDLRRALQLCGNAKDTLQGLAMLASTLKFDGLSYLVLSDGTSADCVSFHWTTAGRDWSRSYARGHYQSIDPRIVGTRAIVSGHGPLQDDGTMIAGRVGAEGLRLTGVLATHWHADHVGGDLMGYPIEGIRDLVGRDDVTAPVHLQRPEADWVKLKCGNYNKVTKTCGGASWFSAGCTPQSKTFRPMN